MEYEDIEDGKLPQAVQDKMMALIQMEPDALINEVLGWGAFYGRWAILCRRRAQDERLKYINEGTFNELAAEYTKAGDEVGGTLLTTLWCMPDVFLDDVIKIHHVIEAGPPQGETVSD